MLRLVKTGPRKRSRQRRWGGSGGEGARSRGVGGGGSESWESFKEEGRPAVLNAAESSNIMRALQSLLCSHVAVLGNLEKVGF